MQREILFVVINKSCLWWFDSHCWGLMLRKLVISDCVHVSSGLVLENGGRMAKWHIPACGDFCWELKFKCRQMRWPSHWKKNFFINNSVGLSMRDGLTETVKYLHLGEYLIHDWLGIVTKQQKYTSFACSSDSWTTRSAKT